MSCFLSLAFEFIYTIIHIYLKLDENILKKEVQKKAPLCIMDVYSCRRQPKTTEEKPPRRKTPEKAKGPQTEPNQFTKSNAEEEPLFK